MGLFRRGPSAGSPGSAIKPAGEVWLAKLDEYLAPPDEDGHPTQIVDNEAPFGKPRYYRAAVYTVQPWLSSPWSDVVAGVLTGATWALGIPGNALAQMEVDVVPPLSFNRNVESFVGQPAGASLPIVVRDGGVRGRAGSVKVRVIDTDAVDLLRYLVEYDGTLLLRDPFGDAWYLAINENITEELLHASKTLSEPDHFLTRQVYEVDLGFVQSRRAGIPTQDPLAQLFVTAEAP